MNNDMFPQEPTKTQVMFYGLKMLIEAMIFIGFWFMVPKTLTMMLFASACAIVYWYWVYDTLKYWRVNG